MKLTSFEKTFFTIITASNYSDIDKTKSKLDTDEKYVLDLCDKVLGIASSRQHDFDFPVDGFYDDFNCDKQNNIIRDPAFDEKVVRKKLTSLS